MENIERFNSKTQRDPSGCLIWTAGRTPRGYGVFWANGKQHRAARWIFEQTHGPLAEGILVRHSCDNPPCVEVTHLLAGTPADNSQDAVDRGRTSNQHVGQTHCARGHEFNDENTYTHQGRRYCRPCRRITYAERKNR